MTESNTESRPPVACTATSEQQEERSENVRTLVARYVETTERGDGYTFVFEEIDETLPAIAEFVTNERKCCAFADYEITVSPPYEKTRLTTTGPEGTKAVFEEMIELLEEEKRTQE